MSHRPQRIKIVSPENPSGDGPFSAHGTRVWLNDFEVKELVNIHAHWPVRGAVQVELELLANKELNFEGNGVELHVTVVCQPEYELIEEQIEDGRKKYYCVEREK